MSSHSPSAIKRSENGFQAFITSTPARDSATFTLHCKVLDSAQCVALFLFLNAGAFYGLSNSSFTTRAFLSRAAFYLCPLLGAAPHPLQPHPFHRLRDLVRWLLAALPACSSSRVSFPDDFARHYGEHLLFRRLCRGYSASLVGMAGLLALAPLDPLSRRHTLRSSPRKLLDRRRNLF